tara:strand:+ start:1893 stop:2663 length:771 start_codon:yes stop_codon:yes gene_type:complete
MSKFNLNDYEMVEDRLKKFWSDNPEGRIETNVVHITDDGSCVTIKAEVFPTANSFPVATGIAQETKGQGGFANADAWMENCETSAIGRALANWKYQGNNKKRPSREEMSKSAPKTSEQAQPKSKGESGDVKSTPVSTSSDNPVKAIKEAGFGDRGGDKHPNGKLAINATGLLCPCESNKGVKYYSAAEKNKPNSPDFRCQAMGDCTAGDTVDGKVFAKSWWMDNKQTPESWKDYAAAQNGIKLPDANTIPEGDIPF